MWFKCGSARLCASPSFPHSREPQHPDRQHAACTPQQEEHPASLPAASVTSFSRKQRGQLQPATAARSSGRHRRFLGVAALRLSNGAFPVPLCDAVSSPGMPSWRAPSCPADTAPKPHRTHTAPYHPTPHTVSQVNFQRSSTPHTPVARWFGTADRQAPPCLALRITTPREWPRNLSSQIRHAHLSSHVPWASTAYSLSTPSSRHSCTSQLPAQPPNTP